MKNYLTETQWGVKWTARPAYIRGLRDPQNGACYVWVDQSAAENTARFSGFSTKRRATADYTSRALLKSQKKNMKITNIFTPKKMNGYTERRKNNGNKNFLHLEA